MVRLFFVVVSVGLHEFQHLTDGKPAGHRMFKYRFVAELLWKGFQQDP